MKKILLLFISFLMLIVGCSAQNSVKDSSTPSDAHIASSQILMLIDELYYDDYIRIAIDKSISDNTPLNCEFQVVVLKRDRASNYGYSLPKVEIDSWASNHTDKKALILYGVNPESNIQRLTHQLKNDVCIIYAGLATDETFFYNYNISIDYDELYREIGVMLADSAQKNGDILFSGILKYANDELSSKEQQIQDATLNELSKNVDVTFSYGKKYAENPSDEAENSTMADRYLSQQENVIGIVGQTNNTCKIWSDAIARNNISCKPLIFGTADYIDEIMLIDNNSSLVMTSNPYAYYLEIQSAIVCAQENFQVSNKASQKNVFVKLPLICSKNYYDHLEKYKGIYKSLN